MVTSLQFLRSELYCKYIDMSISKNVWQCRATTPDNFWESSAGSSSSSSSSGSALLDGSIHCRSPSSKVAGKLPFFRCFFSLENDGKFIFQWGNHQFLMGFLAGKRFIYGTCSPPLTGLEALSGRPFSCLKGSTWLPKKVSGFGVALDVTLPGERIFRVYWADHDNSPCSPGASRMRSEGFPFIGGGLGVGPVFASRCSCRRLRRILVAFFVASSP